ncbi:hypothetical protein OK414_12945 [Priestia sp. JV24]|uniref:hypothetical protein n=1 Tax=Priestia TaxID=2800373 RepID=UPI0021D67AC0|nr:MULTISPECIES: hypothetical protein [Priestia]MCU7711371.1 hypothetical protein [Priestia megaterium]MCW1045952.1 hypothetical protein [Priestia sp. JV24]
MEDKNLTNSELIPVDQGKNKIGLANFGTELLANAATSGVMSQLIQLSTKGAGDLGLFLSLGIPSLGVASTLFDSFQSKKNIQVLELELEKLKRTVEVIDEKMEKHKLTELINISGANLNLKMYEFLKNAFTEAVNAKTEKIREFCGSFLTFVGGFDYDGKDIDFRRLYMYLDYIKQLDELDFNLLKIYLLVIQNFKESQNEKVATELQKTKSLLLEDSAVTTLEIKLSINKLARFGLFDNETSLHPYENPDIKNNMINQIQQVNSLEDPSPLLEDFCKHVFTFI